MQHTNRKYKSSRLSVSAVFLYSNGESVGYCTYIIEGDMQNLLTIHLLQYYRLCALRQTLTKCNLIMVSDPSAHISPFSS